MAFSFAGSSVVAKQIDASGGADIFISADEAWMDYLEKRGRIVPASRENLLGNHLVLIAPKASAVEIKIAPHFDLAMHEQTFAINVLGTANTLAPFIVLITAQLGSAILIEAALSFLGLGVPEPYPSWGRMLSENAAEYAQQAPWLVIFPGVAISVVVFATNLLGDALRDILDPRLRL